MVIEEKELAKCPGVASEQASCDDTRERELVLDGVVQGYR